MKDYIHNRKKRSKNYRFEQSATKNHEIIMERTEKKY